MCVCVCVFVDVVLFLVYFCCLMLCACVSVPLKHNKCRKFPNLMLTKLTCAKLMSVYNGSVTFIKFI